MGRTIKVNLNIDFDENTDKNKIEIIKRILVDSYIDRMSNADKTHPTKPKT